jgi:hypothetical protein
MRQHKKTTFANNGYSSWSYNNQHYLHARPDTQSRWQFNVFNGPPMPAAACPVLPVLYLVEGPASM